MKYIICVTTELNIEITKEDGVYQAWRVSNDGSKSRYGFGNTQKDALDSAVRLYKKSHTGKNVKSVKTKVKK